MAKKEKTNEVKILRALINNNVFWTKVWVTLLSLAIIGLAAIHIINLI